MKPIFCQLPMTLNYSGKNKKIGGTFVDCRDDMHILMKPIFCQLPMTLNYSGKKKIGGTFVCLCLTYFELIILIFWLKRKGKCQPWL